MSSFNSNSMGFDFGTVDKIAAIAYGILCTYHNNSNGGIIKLRLFNYYYYRIDISFIESY